MAPKRNGKEASSNLWDPKCSGFLLACFLAIPFQILFFSHPVSSAFHLPKISTFKGMIKLGEGIVNNPEDVSVDRNGVLYTATRDGWIKRMHTNGTWENWKNMNSTSLLGITVATKANDELLVCDSVKGLLKVGEDGVTVLASLRFVNDVIQASDGIVYFTVSSTKYTPKEYYLDLIEAEPHGQLLKYDPSSKNVSVVLDRLYFANGVALSKHEDFVVVCESWKCIKHWLSGRKGTEIFVQNLPGGPDNINLASDGSFWISIIEMNARGVMALQSCKEKEELLQAYPELIKLLIPFDNRTAATVVNVAVSGHETWEIRDPNASYLSFVTSALRYDDHLYLASINSNFIGKLPLKLLK